MPLYSYKFVHESSECCLQFAKINKQICNLKTEWLIFQFGPKKLFLQIFTNRHNFRNRSRSSFFFKANERLHPALLGLWYLDFFINLFFKYEVKMGGGKKGIHFSCLTCLEKWWMFDSSEIGISFCFCLRQMEIWIKIYFDYQLCMLSKLDLAYIVESSRSKLQFLST